MQEASPSEARTPAMAGALERRSPTLPGWMVRPDRAPGSSEEDAMSVASPNATSAAPSAAEHHVADLSLAAWGRREIHLAEGEMPALMAVRRELVADQPLQGARIAGSLHMTIQTAGPVETLKAPAPEGAGAGGTTFPP